MSLLSRHFLPSRTVLKFALLVLTSAVMSLSTGSAALARDKVSAPVVTDGHTVSLTLQQLGAGKLVMRTADSARDLYFGVRRDEVVAQAKLTLVFTPSPALLAKLSHLRVLLNERLITVIDITEEMVGKRVQRDIAIDPAWFVDDNWLRLEAVNHYSNQCEDPLHLSLWNEIDTTNSVLNLSVNRVDLSDDLSLLPAPFFDSHDVRPLVLPIMLGATPQHSTLRVAGMMASWFGSLAGYRTAQFPAVRDGVPTRHALVLATPTDMPAGLGLPQATGPAVYLMRHPQDPRIKLLVLQGRTVQELETAALGLILGQQALSGNRVQIKTVELGPRRAAYDAPNWVPTNRPVRLGELVDSPKRLELNGVVPASIEVNWRTPPDLWLRQGQGATLDLKYRASTPPKHAQGSLLNLTLNNALIRSWSLSAVEKGEKPGLLKRWLPNQGEPFEQVKVQLLDFPLGTSNNISVAFPLGVKPVDGWCAWRIEATSASVDASSTLDFSHLPHYLRMPELSTFANSGFPFSRYADLAETAVVLPTQASDAELQTFFSIMGSFGRWTGAVAQRFTLVTPQVVQAGGKEVKDRDLLLVGSAGLQPLLEQWRHTLASPMGAQRQVTVAAADPVPTWRNWWPSWERLTSMVKPAAASVQFSTAGDLAVIQGFESPLRSGRSVVALSSTEPQGLMQISQVLLDPARVGGVQGDLVIVRGEQVRSFAVGSSYHVGDLPLTGYVSLMLTEHSVLAGFLALLLLLVLVWFTRQRLIERAAKRLK